MSDELDEPERVFPYVLKLKHPIEHGSTITELTFRRGKLGDIKNTKVDEMPSTGDLLQIAAKMCAQPLKVIESLDGDDATEVLEIALGFFTKCLQGGTTR